MPLPSCVHRVVLHSIGTTHGRCASFPGTCYTTPVLDLAVEFTFAWTAKPSASSILSARRA
eukprot:scaffold181903_cov30-Tisochrysis_lutea.AAC.3